MEEARIGEILGIVVVAVFGVLALVTIWLSYRLREEASSSSPIIIQREVVKALESSLESGESPSPKPKPKNDFTWSEKLEIVSPTAGTFSTKTVEVPMTGELKKVTVRPTAADEDDYFQLLYGNRVLIHRIYVYGATAASHTFLPETDRGIPISKGGRLTLKYMNAGSTSKDVDITLHSLVS